MNIRSLLIFFFVFMFMKGCFKPIFLQDANQKTSKPLLALFYTTGGDGPLISYYYIYDDGWIQQVTMGERKDVFRVNKKELDLIKELLWSIDNEEVWSALDDRKSKPRCCDWRYVEIRFGSHHFFLTEGDSLSNGEIVLIKKIDIFLQRTIGKKYSKWGRLTDILE